MDKYLQPIIIVSVTILLTAISRKYLEPLLPDKEKAISYIKSFVLFNIKYSLNLGLIIYYCITLQIGKKFVVMIVILVCLMVYNFLVDFILGYISKINKINAERFRILAEEIDKLKNVKYNNSQS